MEELDNDLNIIRNADFFRLKRAQMVIDFRASLRFKRTNPFFRIKGFVLSNEMNIVSNVYGNRFE